MAFLAHGDTYATSSVIADIAKDLHVTIPDAAMSVTAYMLAFGSFTLIFGPLSDRFGKANVINIAVIGSALFSILSGFAEDVYTLIAFRGIGGMFSAAIMPVSLSLLGDTFDEDQRQGAIAKMMGYTFLGAATATAIGGAVAYLGSWKLVYIIYGVARLMVGLLMLKILVKTKPVAKKFAIFSFYKEAFQNKNLLLVISVLFFNGFAVFGSFSYTGIFFIEKTQLNTFIVGIMLSSFGVGTVIGGRLAPIVKKNFPNTFLVLVGIAGFIAYMTASQVQNPFLLCICLALFGATFIVAQSTLITNAQGRLPHMKGTVMSLTSLCMYMGGSIGTHVNSLILPSQGVNQIFIHSSILFLFAALFAHVVTKRKI